MSNSIREISFQINDSFTKRTMFTMRGSVYSIKHETSLYACQSPVLKDRLYKEDTGELGATVEHSIRHLRGSTSCDSLLIISTVSVYREGSIARVNRYKTVGPSAKFPCGDWEYYQNKALVFDTTLVTCQSAILENIELTHTAWRPV